MTPRARPAAETADRPGRGASIAVLLPALEGGGAERTMLNLADAIAGRGLDVDLVLCEARGAYLDHVPASVRLVALAPAPRLRAWAAAARADPGGVPAMIRPFLHPPRSRIEIVRYLPPLVAYLDRRRPQAMIAALTDTNLIAVWAARLAATRPYVLVSERNHLSAALRQRRSLRRRLSLPLVRRTYEAADGVVAVSNGVADDLAATLDLPRRRVVTIYNPVIPAPESGPAPPHPWLAPGMPPVVLAAGRLHPQKDFAMLLRAFARLRSRRPARLIVLGEGRLRPELEALARDLGAADDVDFPGFRSDPAAWMARAATFALTSRYEGFPNVLVEALSAGCPVVSTDCPSGPAEILDGGRFGRLVPVADDGAMTAALEATLDAPPDRAALRDRARSFSVDAAVGRYLDLCGL